MAFSYIGGAYGHAYGAVTTLDCSGTLNVAAGDLLVASVKWESGASTISINSTASDNAFTMLTTYDNVSQAYLTFGYVLSASANASSTFRATLGTARAYSAICVMQFRPDSGETVTFEAGPAPNNGNTLPVISGNISVTGDDIVCVGAEGNYNETNATEEQIADTAADGSIDTWTWHSQWYKLFTSSQSNIHAQCTAHNNSWVCEIVGFKSAAASGGGSTSSQHMMHLARQRRR